MDLADFTYSAAALSRWSVLEPTLGIVNACLPLLRPVIRQIRKAGILSSMQGTTNASEESNMERRFFSSSKRTSCHTNEIDTRSFRRLADPYPLEDDPVVRSQIAIGKASSGGHSPDRAKNAIEVTTG